MTETGQDRIKILFELLEYAEQCLKTNYLKKHSDASDDEVTAHISNWYGQSEHFIDREHWQVRDKSK